jgi:hypothetical protein
MQYGFRKNYIILAVIVFLLFAIAFWFLYHEIQTKNDSSEKILTEWQTEDSRRTEIKTIMKSASSIETNNEIISQHFVNSSNLVPFLDTIDSFAPKVNAEDEITFVDILPDTKELVVGVRVFGSFESVYKFLTLLENSPYEVQFLSVDIKKSSGIETSNKTSLISKSYPWEGLFKIKLLTFIP